LTRDVLKSGPPDQEAYLRASLSNHSSLTPACTNRL